MSKLSDYSKFDHLVVDDDDDDDEEDDNDHHKETLPLAFTTPTAPASVMRHVRKQQPTTTNQLRFLAQYQGQTVYEWEQSLNEVLIYIESPLNHSNSNYNSTDAKIVCQISATHLKVGIQPQNSSVAASYYIDEDTYHPIDTKESTWCLESEENGPNNKSGPPQNIITIYLQKVAKGLVWDAPLRGRHSTTTTLDPRDRSDVQQALLLERWQEENPGMDFREATFQNGGHIPDPRTYMGGIGYQ